MRPGDTWRVSFFLTGTAAAAPTAVLAHNTAKDTAVGTLTATAGGLDGQWCLSAPIPATGYAPGDLVELIATATVGGVTQAAVVARGYMAAPVDLGSIAGSAQAAANLSADELATAPTLPAVDGSGRVSLNLAQAGLAPRDLSGVADASLTVGDALVAAIAGAAGKEAVSGTTYTVKTPLTGTVIRAFTLDSSTAPTSRT